MENPGLPSYQEQDKRAAPVLCGEGELPTADHIQQAAFFLIALVLRFLI
ncbi:rCG39185, isoform CRA_b [Rattus norvegicus]|uniref:RCG39185, isoform CRA_b n=1 Tax=Rattus norvegicus TaxID=10116 RepID=A6KMG2_RAT|nr:rCG39185, isoform CRA_b [Rattus norvegicus]